MNRNMNVQNSKYTLLKPLIRITGNRKHIYPDTLNHDAAILPRQLVLVSEEIETSLKRYTET